MPRWAWGLFSILVVGGCSGPPREAAAPPKKQTHIWSAETNALEKAKGVERTLEDAARRRDRLLQQQER
jgi:hypothetical protein